MILEIDAGNTRIKWRLVMSGIDDVAAPLDQNTFVANTNASGCYEQLAIQLSALPLSQLKRVLVANVRGKSFVEFLSGFLRGKNAAVPEFAIPSSRSAAVANGYDDPAKLGVDRWLAILAAYKVCGSACFILDCGTTITLDVVNSGGEHLGGYIVPGINLMRDALANRSAALVQVAPGSAQLTPGNNTASAISNGLLAMVVGFVAQIKNESLSSSSQAEWFICGGDAELVQRFLPWKCNYVPALVLDGLRLAMP